MTRIENEKSNQSVRQDRPALYQICVQGRISDRWSNWFGGLTVTTDESEDGTAVTSVSGVLVDQAALLGLLQKLYSLGCSLLEVKRLHNES